MIVYKKTQAIQSSVLMAQKLRNRRFIEASTTLPKMRKEEVKKNQWIGKMNKRVDQIPTKMFWAAKQGAQSLACRSHSILPIVNIFWRPKCIPLSTASVSSCRNTQSFDYKGERPPCQIFYGRRSRSSCRRNFFFGFDARAQKKSSIPTADPTLTVTTGK